MLEFHQTFAIINLYLHIYVEIEKIQKKKNTKNKIRYLIWMKQQNKHLLIVYAHEFRISLVSLDWFAMLTCFVFVFSLFETFNETLNLKIDNILFTRVNETFWTIGHDTFPVSWE